METREHFDNDREFHIVVSSKDNLSSPSSGALQFGFCAELQKPIKLTGNWKVAIKKVSFMPGQFIPAYADRHNWKISIQSPHKTLNKNFAETHLLYTVELDKIEIARCKKVKTLMELIQQTLKKTICKGDEELAKKLFSIVPITSTPINLDGKEEAPKVVHMFSVEQGYKVYISRFLADIFGCSTYASFTEKCYNHNPNPDAPLVLTSQPLYDIPEHILEADLSLAFQHNRNNARQKPVSDVTILADIVQDKIISNQPEPVLSRFAMTPETRYGIYFQRPEYKKVVKSEFSVLNFQFVGDEGHKITLESDD